MHYVRTEEVGDILVPSRYHPGPVGLVNCTLRLWSTHRPEDLDPPLPPTDPFDSGWDPSGVGDEYLLV